MRKLVTFRTVNKITPINGADKIVLASIDGWNCVVKKDEFNVGDKGVFFEIDSLIPATGTFSFLESKAQYKHGGDQFEVPMARIKTIKLRGVISQGLLLPINLFDDLDFTTFTDDDDLSSVFGVVKYEPYIPQCLRGNAEGVFPTFLFKSDQERVQNKPDINVFSKENNIDYEVTLKLNGCSMTVFYQQFLPFNHEGVCSRNYQLKLDQDNNYYVTMNKKLDIIGRLKEYHKLTGKNYAVQGEMVGGDIQGNYEKFKELSFFVFDVFDINEQRFLLPEERRKVVEGLGLQHVPVLHESFSLSTFSDDNFIADILKFAEGKSINTNVREGVVFKSNQLVQGRPLSFKAISNVYLASHDTD